jgi:hypothetical protein
MLLGKISGSHGGEYEDGCLLGCCRIRPDDGGRKHLWNVGKFLPDYVAQQHSRQPYSECYQFNLFLS